VGEPKTRSSDQSHHHQTVFNVIAGLHCVVPEVECLRDMAAKTDQQKQKSTELKKLSPHIYRLNIEIPCRTGRTTQLYR
jgi:hypothetical protein